MSAPSAADASPDASSKPKTDYLKWCSAALLIIFLVLLIIALIVSIMHVPYSESKFFHPGEDMSVKITVYRNDHAINLDKVPNIATDDIDRSANVLYEQYGAVSIRRGDVVVSKGYIDPLTHK